MRLMVHPLGQLARHTFRKKDQGNLPMSSLLQTSHREFMALTCLASIGMTLRAQTNPDESHPDPILWSVERGKAKVYIFGFADAKDRSWLTPKIQRAFDDSQEIWFETPGAAAGSLTEAERKKRQEEDDRIIPELSHDDTRSLFDALGPEVGDRTLRMANELRVPKEQIEHLRPWYAYFVLNSAFQRTIHREVSEYPDRALGERAVAEKKIVHTELATPADATRWFAGLPDEVQREHMEDLLDYIDDEKAGINQSDYSWIVGHEDTHTLDRMRTKRPAMYKAFQLDRNVKWANRIAEFLSTGKTYFIAIGRNHTVGPDSIPICLEQIGLKPEQV